MAYADRLIQLFHEAKGHLPGLDLDRFLVEACSDDPELRDQVRSLLAAHQQIGTFLLPPPTPPGLSTERPGDTIGQYRLLEQIGEGGCGVVYRAEQEKPVRRQVALKLIKLGMDTREVVARFEAERQALAVMEHPHIARVLEAGATPAGRPYFVMELVRGGRITDFCEKSCLSVEQRIALFIQVCQAVQHAHQKGVIHRDLKPSNVLITVHDGVPVPKVIDFGIAKATADQQLADRTVFTAFEQFLGTPAYMSPEQADGRGLDIDTRTDIYSLGVLLYELLTGSPPFDAKELMAQGVYTMRRTICDTDPPRPSTRVRRAKADGLPVAQLHSPVAPDLDWIVMKCLEKDRGRRYATANGLAADLTRHLNNEPVMARPPSAAYRLQKAVRRHRLAVAAAGAVTVSLCAGLAMSLWKTAEANQARRAAQEALREATDRDYAAKMNLARLAWNENSFGQLRELLRQTAHHPNRGLEWDYWQRQTHLALLTLRGHFEAVVAVAFSPDGSRLVTGSFDTTARVWDAVNGVSLRILTGHSREVRAVAFSHDGKRIATASGDGTARVWEAESGRELLVLEGHEKELTSVAFSREGRRLVTGSRDRTMRVWDVTDRGESVATDSTELAVFEHAGPVCSVVFSADGASVLVGSGDEQATLWDLASRQKRLPSIQAPTARVPQRHARSGSIAFTAAFSPDEKTIATGSLDQTARFWSATNGSSLFTAARRAHWPSILQEDVPFELAFAPDGKWLVTGGLDRAAAIWTMPPGAEPRLILKGHDGEVAGVAVSPDGRRVATASFDHTVKVWDAVTSGQTRTLDGHALVVPTGAFSPGGQRVVTGSWDGTAKIWEVSSGRLLHILPHDPGGGEQTNQVWEVAFSHDGERVLTGGDHGSLKLWDAATGRQLAELKGHTRLICSLAFLDDNKRILTASADGLVRIWAPPNEEPLLTLKEDYPADAVISPDGRRIATAGQSLSTSRDGWRNFSLGPDGVVSTFFEGSGHLWDAASGRKLFSLAGHQGGISVVAFSPDSKRVVTGGLDATAIVWDASNGRLLHRLRGHRGRVAVAAFSADGRRILTSGFDRNTRVWDANSGEELLSIAGVMAFALSPDGRHILTAGPPPAQLLTLPSRGQIEIWEEEERAAAERLEVERREFERTHRRP